MFSELCASVILLPFVAGGQRTVIFRAPPVFASRLRASGHILVSVLPPNPVRSSRSFAAITIAAGQMGPSTGQAVLRYKATRALKGVPHRYKLVKV